MESPPPAAGADPRTGPPDHAPQVLPNGVSLRCSPGMTVLDAAAQAALPLEAPCGGRKLCGKCRVAFVAGAPAPSAVEAELLSADDLAAGVRLACRSRPSADATVRLLPPPRTDWWKIAGAAATSVPLDPAVRVVRCRPAAATLARPTARASRLQAEIGEFQLPLPVLRDLRGEGDGRGEDGALEVVVVGDEVAEVRPLPRLQGPDDTRPAVCGVALDIGTTTIVGYLCDLRTGRQLAAASAMNPQRSFGADLISRLHAVLDDPANAERLRQLLLRAVGRIVAQCCRDAGCAPDRVFEVTVAANTCMHHFFLGLDVTPLARSPFAPVITEGLDVPASDVGLSIHPRGRVYVLPNVAGFVGADAVAGLLASGLGHGERWGLLLDIGTNAEVVLGHRERILACSAAAGPAFEGGNISCGTVARDGAISRVAWEGGRLRAETVGGSPATGLCGSGLLDAAAVLVGLGVVRPSGRLLAPEAWPEGVRAGVPWSEEPEGVVLAEGETPVVLTQRDVRELQLAKGAVRAACDILLRTAGIGPEDLGEVLLAGAFGNYMDPGSVLAMGLIPPVHPSRLRSVGNVAGTGAKLALLARGAREDAAALRDAVEYVELSTTPGFQDAFADAMRLSG